MGTWGDIDGFMLRGNSGVVEIRRLKSFDNSLLKATPRVGLSK